MTIREAEAEGPAQDYRWAEQQKRRVDLASPGHKRAHQNRFKKKRLASLKREIARFGSGKGR